MSNSLVLVLKDKLHDILPKNQQALSCVCTPSEQLRVLQDQWLARNGKRKVVVKICRVFCEHEERRPRMKGTCVQVQLRIRN